MIRTNTLKQAFRYLLGLSLLWVTVNYSNAAVFSDIGNLSKAQVWAEKSANSTHFIENKGQIQQTDGQPAPYVKYMLNSGNANIYLLEDGSIAYQFNRLHYPEDYEDFLTDGHHRMEQRDQMHEVESNIRLETYRMDMKLLGANPNATIIAEGKSNDYFQYYTHDALFVHHYQKITYKNVYPGIDWVIYTTQEGGMKYDFVVYSGADPSQIRLQLTHHEELYVDAEGNLIHGNRMGRFTEKAPVSFQRGKTIATRFELEGSILTFALADYDKELTLVIDPTRIWATYYGGSSSEWNFACSTDGSGNVYIAGETFSSNSIAFGGHQNNHGGNYDAYLVKFESGGVRQWATYYGGSGLDFGFSCSTDNSGNVYLSGNTSSSIGIADGGYNNTFGGEGDAFLVKFNESGVRLWATYYGGSGPDDGFFCTTDNSNNVFLAGRTQSTSGISYNGHQNSFGGDRDAFLVKFNANGVRLWATYYGGSGLEYGFSCVSDVSGNVYLSGSTYSTNNISYNGHQNMYGGDGDAFLVKFNESGVRLWATYYGGSEQDVGRTCATDNIGNVYLSGSSESSTNIASGGHQNVYEGGMYDAFLVKFNSSGARQWGTYYGGSGNDQGYSCDVDGSGNVFMAGKTQSTNNIAYGGHQNLYGGSWDAFLVKFNDSGVRQWATYYGGSGTDYGHSCAVDSNGDVYLAGITESTSNIAYGGHQNTYGGDNYDAFLVKFAGGSASINDFIFSEISFLIFPNPNQGEFTIQSENGGIFEFYDINGKLLHSLKISEKQTSIQLNVASGIYFIRETETGVVQKFIVE